MKCNLVVLPHYEEEGSGMVLLLKWFFFFPTEILGNIKIMVVIFWPPPDHSMQAEPQLCSPGIALNVCTVHI